MGRSGVKYIACPTGSVADQDIFAACEKLNITFVEQSVRLVSQVLRNIAASRLTWGDSSITDYYLHTMDSHEDQSTHCEKVPRRPHTTEKFILARGQPKGILVV